MTIYDLSVPLHNDAHFWQGDPAPQITRLEDHARGDAWTTTHLSFCAHFGTHVDAPKHRLGGGKAIDALDLNTLVGRAYVADLTHVASQITARDLAAAKIPSNVRRLLCKTRNGALWKRDGFQTDFVALSGDGAQWIVEHDIRLVAMDYLSADVFSTQEFAAHEALLGADVVLVEGVMLEAIAAGWYTLICLPIKVAGADGAPARAILIADRNPNLFDDEEEK